MKIKMITQFAAAMILTVGGTSVAKAAGGTYTLGGLVGAISGDSDYGWDGSENAAFRAALQTAANFGASGTVTTQVITTNVTSTSNLTGINWLVIPWWANGSASPTQVNQVYAFFTAGGDLLLGDDDSTNDPMGIKLGLPTLDNATSNWTAAGALANGPFGTVSAINAAFDIGYLNTSSVTSLGGTVGSTDGVGRVTSAYWPKGAFCPTCGALVLIADIDTWATEANYSPLNANGKFSLNAVAYLINNSGNITPPLGNIPSTPVPPSIWLALVGFAGVSFYALSTRRFSQN
jgi:hypothetical protein